MIVTDESFDSVIKSHNLVLIDFWAPWCGPCKKISPILDEISDEHTLWVGKLNVDIDSVSSMPVKSILTLTSPPSLTFIASLLITQASKDKFLLSSVPGLSSVLNGFAQSAQFAQVFSFASSFLGGGGNPLEAGTVTPVAAVNTVNRQTVNQAVLAIIGNSKISTPDFSPTA